MLKGSAVIVFLHADEVGDSLNLVQWLDKNASTALAKNPTFFVQTGSSVWIPLGYMPLVIGVPSYCLSSDELTKYNEARKAGQQLSEPEVISYGLTLCFDSISARSCAEDLKTVIQNVWMQASNYIFSGAKTHKDVKAWLELMSPNTVEEPPDTVGDAIGALPED